MENEHQPSLTQKIVIGLIAMVTSTLLIGTVVIGMTEYNSLGFATLVDSYTTAKLSI